MKNFHHKLKKAFFFSFITAILFSCQPVVPVVLVGDPYLFREKNPSNLMLEIRRSIESSGMKLNFYPILPAASAAEALNSFDSVARGSKGIVLSGIYSGNIYSEIRKRYPESKIILINGSKTLVGKNTWVINSSRVTGAKNLGLILGIWLKNQKIPKAVKAAGAFYVGNPERQMEFESFKEGLLQYIPNNETVFQSFYRLRESESFRDLISSLNAQDPGVFVCFGSVNNPQFLEQITNGPFVLDAFTSSHPKGPQVMAYLEEDWIEIGKTAVKALSEDTGREIIISSQVKMNPDFKFTVQKPISDSR